MWVWLKLKAPKGHFCVVSVTATFFVIKFLYAQPFAIPESANTAIFRPKHPKRDQILTVFFITSKLVWLIWSCPVSEVFGGFIVPSETVSYPNGSRRKFKDMK